MLRLELDAISFGLVSVSASVMASRSSSSSSQERNWNYDGHPDLLASLARSGSVEIIVTPPEPRDVQSGGGEVGPSEVFQNCQRL